MAEDEETRDVQLREMVERLDRLVSRDGAHLTMAVEGRTTLGSRAGYLRLGIEFLRAGLEPRPATEDAPARVEPELGYLLTPDSAAPFDLCEIDEAISSRPPARSPLGPLGELFAGLLVVAALILLFIGAAAVVGWVF
jgi:hypothetical protein